MKLRFQQEELTFDQPIVVESIIEQINNWLGETHYFSHLIIDGKEVTEQPEEALEMNNGKMQEVQIVAIEASRFINDLLVSTEEYLKRAVPILEVVSEQFTNDPSVKSYHDLNDLFVGLQWLNTMLEVVNQSVFRPKEWDKAQEVTSSLIDILHDFEEALEHKDTVLIADLLSYEIKPTFEQLQLIITAMLDRDGTREQLS